MTHTDATLEALGSLGVAAVLRASGDIDTLIDDLAGAGLTTIEVTYSIDTAPAIIARLAERTDLTIGAGTVTTPQRAEQAIKAGARFLVSPINPPWLIPMAADADVLAIPGCATPTEIWTATDAGAHAIKIFPAARLGGPTYLRDLAAPLPGLRAMPSGGISINDITAYRDAGAWCIGLGGDLTKPTDRHSRRERATRAVRYAQGTA